MALTVAELAFVFGADTKAVDQGYDHVKRGARSTAQTMDSSMTGFWRDEATRTRRAADDYGRAGKVSGEKYKSGFLGATRNMAAGLAAGFGALEVVRFFGDSIKTASDLGETMSKVGVIFGDSKDDIAAWAADTDKNILLTKQQALDAASTFGIFGKAAGKTGSDLASFSLDLTSLAQDFSSFFNARPEDAILAIGSALRGENEPIRQFGVLLDDATLRARALKMGLIETTKDALTPQQKALAAYQEILAQTKDAQGDAKRTQDGFANSSRQMAQEVALLKEAIGTKLLPAATEFVHFMRDSGVPVLTSTVGVVADAAGAFSDLPAPVKAAAAAFVLLKVASALGWTDATARGVRGVGSAMDTLRLKVMLAGDAYKSSRAGVMQFNGNVAQIVNPAGRAASSLNALRTAGVGVGAGLKAGLGGVVGLLGGPWGIALTAATLGVTYFWQEHQKAKAAIDEFRNTLDAETGALTDSSRQWVAKRLLDKGVLEDADALGLSLDRVTSAALGQGSMLKSLNQELEGIISAGTSSTGQGSAFTPQARAAMELKDALNDTNGVVQTSAREQRLLSDAVGDTADATSDAARDNDVASRSYRTLRERIHDARTEIDKLREAENARHDAAVSRRRDEIGLLQTLKDTRKELREGKRTLDENTRAGQNNMLALLDLADQWNTSAPKVRNAKGAYDDLRKNFIDLATAMGGGDKSARAQAVKLANELLKVPPKKQIQFSTPGLKEAIRDVRTLQQLLADTNGLTYPTMTVGRTPDGLPSYTLPSGKPRSGGRSGSGTRDGQAGGGGALRQTDAGIDYDRLASALGGRIAPETYIETLRTHDLSDVRSAEQRDRGFVSVGGATWGDQ